MTKHALSLCLLFLGAPATGHSGTIPSVLSDHTAFLILVSDLSHFRQHIGESPLARLWADPPQGEPGRSRSLAVRIQEQSGLSLPRILDHFDGEAAVVVPDLRLLTGSVEQNEAWAVVAVTAKEDPWQELTKDLQSANKKLGKVRTVKLAGLNARVFVSGSKDSTLSWVWSQGMGFLASSPQVLRELIEARKGGSHLDQTEDWRVLERRSPQGDLTFYADLEGVSALLGQRFSGGNTDSLGAMMGITPNSVVDALGLGAFNAARMTATLHADEAQLDGGVVVSDEPGVARLLAYQPGPFQRPSMIPPDAVFASTSRFRLLEFWNGVMEMMDTVSPGVSFFAKNQMQQIAKGAGLDFERDILGNFGDETFMAYLPRREAPLDSTAGRFNQLSGVRVKNKEKILKAAAAMADWSPFGEEDETEAAEPTSKTRTVRGVEVTVREAPPGKSSVLSYAVVDSMLLLGMGEEDVIDRALDARARGASLWTRAEVKPLLDSVPPEASSVHYWNPAGLGEELETSRIPNETRDLARMLLLELGPSLAYTLKTPEGYFTRVRLRRAFP